MTADQLAALHAKCFTQPRPWSAQEFAELLNSKAVFLCADEFGFALGRVAGPEAELITIAVDPDHRRQGHAQNLMHAFELQAKASGATQVFLEVAETNKAATALYQQFGFSQAGLRKDYYAGPLGHRIAALVMRKDL